MSGLFSSPSPPPMPKPQKPAPMPDTESPAVLEAKRVAALNMLQRAGRESTILTQASDSRPTGDYSQTKLGGQ
jgi:hypothetical protein